MKSSFSSGKQMIPAALIISAVLLSLGLGACRGGDTGIPTPPFSQVDTGDSAANIRTIRPYGSETNFDRISLEEGLSQSTVNDILQDGRGLLWLATENGLNRYDGYNIEVFKNDPADEKSLPGNSVNTLYEDSQERLWIGTDDSGLALFDRDAETFDRFVHSPDDLNSLSSNSIRSILQSSEGYLWIGSNNGLDRIDPTDLSITRFYDALDPTGKESERRIVNDLSEDAGGILWIGTLGGLLSYDPTTESFLDHIISPTEAASNQVTTLFEDLDGLLWIGTLGGGLHMLDTSSGEVVSYQNDSQDNTTLNHNVVTDIVQDHFGALWFGTQEGLDRLSPDRERFIHYRYEPGDQGSLSDNEIRSLFVDQAGVFWVGTTRKGAAKYDPYEAKFTHLAADRRDPRLLSHPEVWTLNEDSNGDLWIGTSDGLDRLNQRTGRITRYTHEPADSASLPHDNIIDLLEDDGGRVWVATSEGLSKYDPKANSFRTFPNYPDDPSGLVGDAISVLHLDGGGNLWIGTISQGLNRFDPETERFTHIPLVNFSETETRGADSKILSIFNKPDEDVLWIGTDKGLVRYDTEKKVFVRYNHLDEDPNSLSHDQVNTIQSDGNQGLWLGTNNGLDHFDPVQELVTHFREGDGLANNVVLGIEIDGYGRLWISTDRGLSRFDPESGAFRNYDTDDGLQSLEFNRGAHFKSSSGILYFGGINGINIFQPESISDNLYSSPLVINGFQIFNRPVEVGADSPLQQSIIETNQIELKGSDSVFSFELASLHYGTPEENQYAYIMEGFDDEWNFVGNRRFATYTNLPPGKYTFHAVATNNDGIWNSEGETIDIVIPYPFWQQWWFIGLVALLVVAGVFAIYRLRNRSIVRRTRELEELVASRTVEIEQRRQIAEGLREILVILNTSPSLEESLHYIVAQAARLTDAEDAIIFRYDESGPITVIATNPGGQIHYSLDSPLLNIVGGWAEEQLLEKEPLVLANLPEYWSDHRELDVGHRQTHRALLGIPLAIGDEVYGGLLMFYSRVRDFGRDDLELGLTFADQAALAIANNRLRERVKEAATASERSRLARELHDAVTQTLFSASLIAETLSPTWESDPSEGRELLKDLRQLTRGALAEMRTLLMELRPATLEEAILADLLNQLSEAFVGRTGIPVKVNANSSCQLPVNVRIALYRIAQESLNNVVKHARANNVDIILEDCSDDEGVILTIRDDGRGFDLNDVPGHRLGLKIIKERAHAIEADLEIKSAPGEGTVVSVQWNKKQVEK